MRNPAGRPTSHASRASAPVVVVTLVALILTLVRTTPARAEDTITAREHYQKGTSFYDLGRYQDAIKEFEAAYEIKNDPALLYNLAQSHRLAGNSDQALHFYRTYLRRFPKAPNRAEIEGRITALEQLVAQKSATQNEKGPPLQMTPPAEAPPPTTGPQVVPPPSPPPADLGSTQMTPPPTAETGAQPQFVTMPLPAAPNAGHAHNMKLLGLGVAGTGGLLFLIGAIEGGRAVGAANEVNSTAKAGGTFDPAVEARGKSAQTAEAALLVLGALIGGAGAALYFYERGQERIAVTPVASANQAGAALRLTF
jgi:tetratricopeptide (TPR) repeat protein